MNFFGFKSDTIPKKFTLVFGQSGMKQAHFSGAAANYDIQTYRHTDIQLTVFNFFICKCRNNMAGMMYQAPPAWALERTTDPNVLNRRITFPPAQPQPQGTLPAPPAWALERTTDPNVLNRPIFPDAQAPGVLGKIAGWFKKSRRQGGGRRHRATRRRRSTHRRRRATHSRRR